MQLRVLAGLERPLRPDARAHRPEPAVARAPTGPPMSAPMDLTAEDELPLESTGTYGTF